MYILFSPVTKNFEIYVLFELLRHNNVHTVRCSNTIQYNTVVTVLQKK